MMNVADECSAPSDQPDVDTIKMFCGQIPRHMNEPDLRQMFEEFGPVFHLNILREKQTGESKGCCFVTFYSRKSALEAQNALHNLRTLPGCHHPIQMKPADTENRNERKLFVGMITKNFDEEKVKELFQSFGTIEDCTILRDNHGKSRGCAFITFQKRQCALNAIRSMHQSQTMEGCSSPLVVKFADTPKDREMRKTQQQYVPPNAHLIPSYGATPTTNPMTNPSNLVPDLGNLMLLQQLLKSYGFVNNHGNMNLPAVNNLLQMFSSNLNLNGTKMPLLLPPPSSSPSGTNSSLTLPDQSVQALHPLNSPRSPMSSSSTPTATYNADPTLFMCNSGAFNGLTLNPASGTPMSNPYSPPPLASLYGNGSAVPTENHHNLQNLVPMSQMNSATSFPVYSPPSYVSNPISGPDGSNLFIYHLPQEYSDVDLIQAFAPFGVIVSAKVFVDKTTNRSKCFGFVSYDNPQSAQSAISGMNGFQIGTKRLKVELKKLRNNDSTRSHASPHRNPMMNNHSNDLSSNSSY